MTEKAAEEMNERSHRPLDGVYAAIGVSLDAENDSPGLRSRIRVEGTKFGMSVLTDIENRGSTSTFVIFCDEPQGVSEVVSDVRP